jgi:hypothetical protein
MVSGLIPAKEKKKVVKICPSEKTVATVPVQDDIDPGTTSFFLLSPAKVFFTTF